MRKSGRKFKQQVAVIPFNSKRTSDIEMDALSALSALKANCHTEQHIGALFVLAELCNQLAAVKSLDSERYIVTHAETVKRLLGLAHGSHCAHYEYVALASSVQLLFEYFRKADNLALSRICHATAKKIARL